MYADKQRGRQSASSQTADVLVRALNERVPDLERPLSDVADLATATARRLGLEIDEIELIQRAAGLHDIGKLAIPDSILNKPTELDPDEAMFMRSHPVIGERKLRRCAGGQFDPVVVDAFCRARRQATELVAQHP
jgi:two-component system cell cycle response regulator